MDTIIHKFSNSNCRLIFLFLPRIDHDNRIDFYSFLKDYLISKKLFYVDINEYIKHNDKITRDGVHTTPEGAELSFEQPSNEDLTIKHKLDTKLEFSSRYIKQFLKPCSFTKYVKLYATKDLPIKFEYNIGYDKIIYMCAPKESD